jgi:hypothetical protein
VSDPALQLRTLYNLDQRGRLVSTREPGAHRPPRFVLIRGRAACVWGIRDDIPDAIAGEIAELAATEPDVPFEDEPLQAQRYMSLVGGRMESGPAFEFPSDLMMPEGITLIEEPEQLMGELADLAPEIDERWPIYGVLDGGRAVSVCFCARLSDKAAEAGVNTIEAYRGRGLAPRVVGAWGSAIRASGRVPLYSTSWRNTASRSVAVKLGLRVYASDWNLAD